MGIVKQEEENKMQKTKSTEKCGCEFTTYTFPDEGESYTFLTKVRCKSHYLEQFQAKWIDAEGEHCEAITPSPILSLESD